MASLLYRAIGWALALMRLPLLLVVSIVWLACLLVLWLPHHLSPGRLRRVVRLVDCVLGHAFLFTCGFLYAPLRRMTFRPGTGHVSLTLAKAGTGEDPVHPGDLIICNSQSPIDIVYLCTNVDCCTGRVAVCSRLRALLEHADAQDYGGSRGRPPHSDLERVLLCGSNSCPPPAPIVVFPEGTTGNGRALLSFTARLAGLSPNQRIHLLGLKYIASDGGFVPTLPLPGPCSLLRFFITLSCQWYNTLHVKWINSASVYASESVPPLDKDPTEFAASLNDVYCALLHTRSVTLGARQKHDFVRAYSTSAQ